MSQDQNTNLFENKVAALVDIQQLAERCRQYRDELQSKDHTIREQQQSIDRMHDEKKCWQPITELGRRELQQKKTDILNRLRAIVHYSGDEQRLTDLQECFAQDQANPSEIERMHRSITKEFQALYPTQAHSTGSVATEFENHQQTDWSAYRLS